MPKGLKGFQKENKFGKRFKKGQPSPNKGIPMSEKQKEQLRKIWKNRRFSTICLICKKRFAVPQSKSNQKYCSRKCLYNDKIFQKARAEKGNQKRKGKHYSPKTEFKKGEVPWNKGLTVKTDERVKKYGLKQRGKLATKGSFKAGKKHLFWKGGKSRSLHGGKKYREWRTAVYKRDSFTCVICGKVGEKIVAHHIKEWKNYLKLRYKLNNGITLCESCHKELHRKK